MSIQAERTRAFYAQLRIHLLRGASSEAPARCFAAPDAHRHDDRHPSASVNLITGAWYCHACGAHGGAYDAALLRGHTPRSAMTLLVEHGLAQQRSTDTKARRTAPTRGPVKPGTASLAPPAGLSPTARDVGRWADHLQRQPLVLRRLALERAIDPRTLRIHDIGLHRGRITIPTPAADGTLVGLLRWLPFDRGDQPKMLAAPGSVRTLFPPPEVLPAGALVLCEGEPDALAARSAGIPAVSIPGVAGWRTSWTQRLARHHVTVALDCDSEGRAAAATIAADLQAAGVPVTVLDLAPDRADGHDLTNHLLHHPADHGLPASPPA